MSNLGLTTAQALKQLELSGPNLLPNKSSTNFLKLVIAQVNFLTLLLVIASALSFFVGDLIDGILILIILLLNTALGSFQEYKASQELQALRKLEVAVSRVIRDGKEIEIPSFELVPKDIVVLESGDKIPADGILVESYDLSVNESSLTGESLSVVKSIDSKDNEVYFGTSVVGGRAKMEITATGMNTRFGKIALTLSNVKEEKTPLEISLNNLAKKIGILAIFISSLLFIFKAFQGESIIESFFTSIALMVAVVPEGLPAIITVLLAIGARRMYKKKALVRKMSAIESLGSVNVICTDKTGTLTKNEMKVVEIVCDKVHVAQTLKASVLCNSASLVTKEDHGTFDILGDTTEGALLLWAKEKDIDIDSVRAEGKILEEIPFDLKRRMMTVVWEEKGSVNAYSKGAPEILLPLCDLPKEKYDQLNEKYKKMASKGLRILAIATKNGVTKDSVIEKNLRFLALIGIADPPREEVKLAIAKAYKAGIQVVMVTGDNELTARAIAQEISLLREGDEILTGIQLDELTDEELLPKLSKIRIFARAIPEHKLRIVKLYQRLGQTVAVTGDGVNDSLALKQAHVGVAMGKTGSEVAKEASDIVILNDDFSTIISAIEEGRVVYSNILKVVKFLMAGNLSEVLIILSITLIGYPIPLLPVQILWINLVTDGLPALSLAFDKGSANVMGIPPRNHSQSLLNFNNLKLTLMYGSFIALVNILIFIFLFNLYDLQFARGSLFTTIVLSQMIFVFLIRPHHSVTSNKYLLWSVGLVLLTQTAIMLFPPLRALFKI